VAEQDAAPAEPERDVFAGLGLSELAKARMRARVAAAEKRRADDAETVGAIRGEAGGEHDPVTGRFIRSRWYDALHGRRVR
jgi:hypothetical protein